MPATVLSITKASRSLTRWEFTRSSAGVRGRVAYAPAISELSSMKASRSARY